MDEELVKEGFFFNIFIHFLLAPQMCLSKHNLLILQTAVPLAKWFWKALDNFS